ncbi:FAD binding domain-containing protein [Planktotalea frisia]|uniref:FAD binding domain-containing protein n=1 Tax=Planktotalea frisia TaxID=696762 RepID=UPI002352069F|nr:xanthine dehydrogenase family protein subunit M [Planktotalea frisia]
MDYLSPTNLDDALAALNARDLSIIAGGTDWYPAQGERPIECDMLDITRIAGLRGVEKTENGWRIGAASTWSDVIAADLPNGFDGLKAAAREVGSIQIQNAGTLVGNLCNASPAADGVPPLLTLDAALEVRSLQGVRAIPLAEFITGVRSVALRKGELVTALLIPDISETRKSAFAKLGARKYLVISIAMVAVTCEVSADVLSDVRIAVGSCSPVAIRLAGLEQALSRVSLIEAGEIIASADLKELSPITDVRGSGAYRKDVVGSLILRALQEAAHG